MKLLKKYLVPILLAWVALLGLWQSYRHTLTSDEAIHTASAYLAITRGDHRFDPEHPFLFKYLTALPFLIYPTKLPQEDALLWERAEPILYDSWMESRVWADHWVYESGNNAKVMQVLMRLPGIATLVVLCWFVYWLTKRWFNEKAALWAIFLTAFTPTLLAHGFLTNTDVPLALAFLITVWRLGEYGAKPTRLNALYVGLALSAALLTKYSAVALIPISLIWLIGVSIVRNVRFVHVLADFGIVVATFFASVWTVYFFQSPVSVTADQIEVAQNQLFSLLGRRLPSISLWLDYAPLILPSAYLKGLVMTIGWSLNGRATYLLGEMHSSGVWYYFPLLYLLKTPLATVLITVAASVKGLLELKNITKWKIVTWALLTAAGVFIVLALKSKLNLGVRHIAPILPIISIALGIFLSRTLSQIKLKWATPLAVLCIAVPVIWQSPNLLAFGNILASPANERYRYFGDSNLDWGQSWERIADVLEKEFPGQPVYLKHYLSPLAYYAPNNNQYDITRAGSQGQGAILVNATDLVGEHARYAQYKPDFIIDNVYYIFTTKLVPK